MIYSFSWITAQKYKITALLLLGVKYNK